MNEAVIDDLGNRALAATGGPSLNVALVRDGTIAYRSAFGNDRVEPLRAATAKTVYNIASVTKQFTAASVLLLARAGKLSLADRVARYFPKLTRANDITLEHLLAHTSGYFDYYPLSYPDPEKLLDTTPDAIIERYAGGPLQFEPGSACSYSNTGFHIAGRIVEIVSGLPFGRFLEERILRPSGMNDSFFNDPQRVTQAHAFGYTRFSLGPLRRAEHERAGWMFASGGLACTAEDLARWICGYFDNRVLSREEVARMTTSFVLNDGTPSNSGLGLFMERRGEFSVLMHGGGLAGFATQIIFSLERRRAAVVFANGDHAVSGRIASLAFEELRPGAVPPVAPGAGGAECVAEATDWFGRFARGDVDRALLSREFDAFLTQTHIEDAQAGLAPLGRARVFERLAGGERGGMPWARVRAFCEHGNADVVLRVGDAGELAEFNVYPVV
jgi:CubicO group peptidase (beta-lactamase class C family)